MLAAIERLRDLLSSLPGIGPKSAIKLALYLASLKEEKAEALLSEISELKKGILECESCHDYSDQSPCRDCLSPYSEAGLLCVVETQADSQSLKGTLPEGSKFHVLGGKLSPLNGIGPENLNLESLQKRIGTEQGLKEILLATGSDIEGEATASFLQEFLKNTRLRISRIAFGISVGSSLSASDERSIQKSISSRIFY